MFILALALAVTAEPPTQPAARGNASGNERICRGGGQRSLGSHIRSTRRCLTAEQWRQEDEASDRQAQNLRITEGQNDGRAPAAPH